MESEIALKEEQVKASPELPVQAPKKHFNFKLILALILIILFLVGLVIYFLGKDSFNKGLTTTTTLRLIGGDKDDHGCLIGAGYSWCEEKNKCLRTWEEECSTSSAKTDTSLENWSTYSNSLYGFSFKYPKEWKTAEKDEKSFGDARRLEIGLNYKDGLITYDSYFVEVLDAGGMKGEQFINSFYGGIENGPSEIKKETIGENLAYKFFMQKAGMTPSGSAFVMFQNNSTVVTVSNMKEGDASEIMSDEMLADIASTVQFNNR